MRLHMPTKSHQPKEEKEPDKDKLQSPFKHQIAVHVIPALAGIYVWQVCLVWRITMMNLLNQNIDNSPKRKRIENQQLIRQILKEITPAERFAALRQVIPKTRKIIADLPQDMRRQQGQSP